ncbi:MAG: FMN-binding negative transcriptional regulator [Planctomycetales bacterium]
MYLPSHFRVDDLPTLHDFIERHSFATLVTEGIDGPFATHLPLLLDRERGRYGTLRGHFARANPHARLDHAVRTSLVIFHGPHAYVSPSWYSGTTPGVPTWNYAAVHASGRLALFDDAARTAAIVEELVRVHESPLPFPWKNDLPADVHEKLLASIVGFELPIERLEGKFKLSQNRPEEDRAGAKAGLESRGDPASRAVAELMGDWHEFSTTDLTDGHG